MRPHLPACLAAALLAACADIPTSVSSDQLNAARYRWQQAGMVDYHFDARILCYCPSARTDVVTVVVASGEPVALFYADSGNAADTTLFRDVLTMERLFSALRQALDLQPYRFTATYHDSLGYPLEVWIDPDEWTADEEIGYRITNVGRLP